MRPPLFSGGNRRETTKSPPVLNLKEVESPIRDVDRDRKALEGFDEGRAPSEATLPDDLGQEVGVRCHHRHQARDVVIERLRDLLIRE